MWGFLILGIILLGSHKIKHSIYSKNILKVLFLLIALFLVSFSINYYLVSSSINNLLWSFVTYGSVLSFLAAILLMRFNKHDIKFVLTFSIIITLLEIIVGYGQMVQMFNSFNPFTITSAAGDYFTGTFFRSGYAHIVALKISLILIYVFVLWVGNKTLKRTIVLVFLIIGWLLPSALYSVILLAIAVIFYFTIYELLPRLRALRFNLSIIFVGIISLLGLLLLVTTQKRNISYVINQTNVIIGTVLEGDISNTSAQKIHFYRTSIKEIPKQYPQSVVIGVGPGNYSSRSSWIVSGLYLANQPFYIPKSPSKVAIQYALPYYQDIVDKVRWGSGSIIHLPFSSWISIYVELGLIGLGLTVWIFILISKKKPLEDRQLLFLSKGNTIAIIYVILLMLVDNILEYPQFFSQFLIFVVMINNVDIVTNKS